MTGASSGLGREFIESLCRDNQTYHLEEIWAVARRKKRLDRLERRFPGLVIGIEADLDTIDGIRTIESALKEEDPMVLFLINSAGRGEAGSFEELSLPNQLSALRLNTVSLTEVTGSVLPYMARGARIINMASGSAFSPQPFFAVYAASKAYVLSFSRALNVELKNRGISVTAVCPGPVRTEFFTTLPWYKKLFMAKPESTVRKALEDAWYRRPVSTTSLSMDVFRLISKLLPHGLIATAEGRLMGHSS